LKSKYEVTKRDILFGGMASVGLITTMYMALIFAPADVVQGDVQRVIYVHVPTAALAYLSFLILAISGIGYLVSMNMFWDRLARSAGLLGTIFTTTVLISGSMWARAIWGVWWTWDARLTTTLVMWFLFLGYLMLRGYVEEVRRRRRVAALMGIVTLIIVPVNYLSVYWWRTLHPLPSIAAPDSPGLPDTMLQTLLVAMCSFGFLFFVLLRLQMKFELISDRFNEVRSS